MNPENQLLQEGANEIKRLRRNNELMHARLEMFDKCMLLFTSSPAYQSRGESEDVVWKMESFIENNKKAPQMPPMETIMDTHEIGNAQQVPVQ